MPVCCDVCGIEALESQEFAQERLPFCRLKRYCPACHKRLYHRVYLLLALAPLFLGTIGLVEVLRGSKSFLQGTGMWFACLVARFFWTEVHVLAIWSSSVGLKDLFWRDIDESEPAKRVDHYPRGGQPDSQSS